ncbi:hypothetical protein [Amycolatopsis sp. 195334CR]|uniref:hypothetical protein n=1 Tax=Amycolatopsis sp. 195334CR TaxID=2814588 RepID=UPI001A8DBC2C|nr:hypothetical protein [Amycolatopsis sp. 195334CR]MBN6036437.1 hypothetical protein [Amycolatopsis sp. 195334CR]
MAEESETTPVKRRLDVFTLLLGIATLGASAYVLTDGALPLPGFDPRWLVAGAAVLIGLLLLGASFSGKKR